MAWQDCWSLKQTEDAKCTALSKVSIFGIQKEIDLINTSDNMAVVATMMESIADVKIKSPKDDTVKLQAYDALIFYKLKKKVTTPVAPAPVEQKPIDIPTVDLNV